MIDRELFTQALEALEEACGDRCNAEYNPCHARTVITSLRQAIEQAEEQEPVAWMYGCVGRGRMYAEELDDPAGWQPLYTTPPAAPVQEPVALENVYETIIHWDEGGGKRSRRELARRIVALYTIPPAAQRQPLTDEEIGLLTTGDGWSHLETPALAKFARAIEAAHGIKGDKA